ncbi:MAG: ABC transporter ATP-binding protein [Candidatus Bathyarchaeia archaeon]
MELLKVEKLTKEYGSVKALDGVSFTLKSGVLAALIGPNGSGKTTLLKILAGLLEKTSGTIIFNGSSITSDNLDYLRWNVTMVFQRSVMFNTTVYKNVAFGLKARGFSGKEVERNVRDVLKLLQLEELAHRNARRLSGGEQQRVSLARALVLKPKLLLLDEPTVNLDPKNAALIEEVVGGLIGGGGMSILMATHSLEQATRLASEAAVMRGGKLVMHGEIGEVYRRLSSPLMGYVNVDNLFKGTAAPMEDGLSMVDLGSGVRIEAVGTLEGEVKVYIDPSDISVSKYMHRSSARNKLWGRVVEASEVDHQLRLKVDVGRVITVTVTRKSFEELGLNIGSRVCLSFKSSSIKVL